jgi:prepilin-type N-terminal cleavage/methylation domain-containing protein/prepilin-type processing-associated H-X9-DG protein
MKRPTAADSQVLPRRHRRAFTLLELLVVIAIVSILIGLLLAAVQRVRSASARVACQNNVKQLALALHQFHDTNDTFPVGHRSVANPMPYTGWTLDILPYIEQQDLYAESLAAFRISPLPFPSPPHVHRATVVKLYTCPSDSRVNRPQVYEQTQSLVAFTSYLGVSGLDYRTRDGVFYRDSRVALADVTDGTSNTLMLGERPPSANFQFGWWYAGSGQLLTGSADIILGVWEQNLLPVTTGSVCGPGAYPFQDSRFNDPCGVFHFWSPHPGGANFAFCDGSVRFVKYGASEIMPQLASRAGGEVVEVP